MSATSTLDAADENPAANSMSFKQIQAVVSDLKTPKASIYWTDFLSTVITGHVLFHVMLFAPKIFGDPTWAWTARVIAYPITVVLYMRAAMFIHELVHLPRQGFTAFRVAWNLLCGIFFLIPSFMYYPHVEHHRRHTYGTAHDGEYMSLSHRPTWWILGFMLQSLVIPILGFVRFLLISPICWVVPAARTWVHRHASTMVVDPFYDRGAPTKDELRLVVLQEVGCFLWCLTFLLRGIFVFKDPLNPLWVTGYLVGIGVVTLNALRTLGAHRWTNEGEEMGFVEQLLDSVNYPHRPWITELWGPIGTRYHALHHLLPSLPYHNMPEAHRRLMEALPKDAPYCQTERVSLLGEIASLWSRARQSQHTATSS